MNKKDIALTVGGVVATMVLAYLLYRLQQRDAAAAVASTQADSEAAAAAAQQAQEAQYSAAWQYQQSYPAITTPTITGATTDTTAAVTTSGATADTGATGTTIDSTDINTLLNNIITAFVPSITSQGATPETVASMTIPTISGIQADALTGIPLTAADAAAEAAVPAITTNTSTTANYPVSMTTGSDVTSHPVTAHPIVSSQKSLALSQKVLPSGQTYYAAN